MVQPARHHRFEFADYLRLEQDGGAKHEFFDGIVWAMARGTREHAAICATIARLLGNQVEGRPCRVYGSDLRVRVRATGLATYPDVTVICGRFEPDPDDPDGHTAVNPNLVVEVLSHSTEVYDRGEKLAQYKQIATLQEVVLVAYDKHEIETVHKKPDGTWQSHFARRGEAAELGSLGCKLSVTEVYADPLDGTSRT
jgi:Uma2 family endonuclease